MEADAEEEVDILDLHPVEAGLVVDEVIADNGQLVEQVYSDEEEENEAANGGSDGDPIATSRQVAVEERQDDERQSREGRQQPGMFHIYHLS